MGKKLYVSDEQSARSLRAKNPEAYRQQSLDTLLNTPKYADIYNSLDDEGKEDLNNFFNEKFEIENQKLLMENMMDEEEQRLKNAPKNQVEEVMQQNASVLGVDYNTYKKDVNRIEELENKRATTSERKKAQEWSNKYSFNPASWINRKYREGREYLDEAFTASAKNLDNPYLGTSDNLAGLTKDETREYYELLRQKREAEKPLAKLLLEDAQNQLKKSLDLKEGQYDSSEGMVYVTPNDVGFFGKVWNIITDSPAEGLYLPENMVDPSSITESEWGGKQAKIGRDVYDQMSSKYDAIEVKRMILEKQSEILDKFINDKDSITAGLGVVAEDLGTAGMYSLVEKIILGKIQNKKLNGEEISPEEEEALKAYNTQQSVSQLDVSKGRFWYRTGEGAGQSAVFLEQTALTMPIGGVGGAATKALTTPLMNKLYMNVATGAMGNLTKGELAVLSGINLVEKGLVGSGNILSQSLAMGNTYNQALDKYIGQTQSVIDKDGNEKILTTNSEREATLKEINNELILNNNERKKLSNSTRPDKEDRLAELDKRDKYLKQTVNSLYDPHTGDVIKDVGAFDAFLYGYGETIKELAAEKYVGELGGKIFNPVGKYISNKTAIGQKVLSPVGNVADKFWSKGQDLVNGTSFGKISQNALYHTGTANLWHGLPGEILEEVAVQLTPSYQDNWVEAWKEQVGQLKDPTFYLDVAAQTILMGVGFSSVGTSQHLANYLTNKDYRQQNKEDRNNRKKIKELYKDIDKSVNDEQLANHILMNTGGTVFEMSDYQAQIASLRDQGRNEDANKLERKSFLNIAINSLKTGTLDRFERSIEKISSNPNLSEETRNNAITSLQYLPELKKLSGEYSGMLNKQELIGLAANKVLQRETVKEIDNKLSSLGNSVITEVDRFKRYNNIENDYSLTDFMTRMKTDEDGQYKSFIDNLRKENSPEINQYLDLMAMKDLYENLEYHTTKEINTKTSKKHQADLAKEYRKALKDTVANTVDKDNIESSKAEVIQELIEEADAELIAKMNAKAIDSAGQAPAVNKTTPNKEKVVIPLTTDDNLSNFFDDIPARETSTDKGNNAVNASDLFDDFEEATPTNLTPEEQAGIDALNQGLYSPINYNPANEKQAEFVDNLSKGFEKLHKKHPQMDFDGLIASLRSAYSGRNVEQRFNLARAAWEKATGETISDTEAQKVYNDNFADVTDISEINSAFGGATPSINNVLPDDIKKSDEAGESNRYEYNPETNQEEKIEYAPHTERKYAGTGLKLGGVLGLNYEETDDGKITITNQVNETAKPFMDWRNFKPGDTVEFVFDMDYLLNPNNMMPIWDNLSAENKSKSDERPVKRLANVRERLVALFKDTPELNTWDKIESALQDYKTNPTADNLLFQNEEFLKIAPVGTVNKGYVTDNKEDGTPADNILMGGLNDYYWINNANLALKVNKKTGEPLLAEREIRLQENRRINLEARKAILQGGSLQVTISENRDAQNNTRILKNEEEKTQGYTNEYHSVLSQFANNIMEFQKNATIAYLDASDNFIGSVNNSGDKVFAKVDGKPIKKENIINYQSYIENAKKKGFDNGRTVFIHKAGVNSLGEPTYLVHDVINNHKTKQDTFKKTREILDRLYFKLAIQNNDSANQRAEKEALQKEFKKQFGYEFTKGIKVDLEGVYPKPHLVNNKKSGLFRQDFSAEAQTPGLFDNIPDLSRFETAEEFLEALRVGQEIPVVNKTEYMLGNLHTNLVFTPIEKNGETIYSHHSQPFMMFDFENNTPNQEQITEENKKRLELKKKYLETQIDKTSNKDEKAELNRELKQVKNELVKENIQQAAQETLKETSGITVTDLHGNEYQVAESDITTYDTDSGPIRYIMDSDRNMIMLKEEAQPETEFTDNDKFDVIEELIGRAFSDIDVSQPITVQGIYKLVENQFNQIVKELKDSGRQQEAQYMLDNRDAILGIGIYEDSVREYINSMLDITEIEEFLDLTGENVKEYGQSSFEVDITKSLSFKVKLLLSGIKDRRLGTGFAGFEGNMSLPDALDALHQVLSEANNNSIEDVKRVIEEKIKKNPTELAFYNQILNRLNTIEKANPEILNEILYNLFQPKVQMRFVMWRADKNGNMTLENYDANVKNPLFIKRSAWTEALKRNGLIDLYEGNNYTVNQEAFERAEKLHTRIFEEYDKSKDITSVNKQDLKRLLHLFGITLNNKTIENIYNQKSQNDLDVATKLLDGKNSILNVLFENLKTAKNEEKRKLTFDNPVSKKAELRKFNILTNRNSQINDLIHADNFVEFLPMSTMYIAGKSINMYQQPNAITNKIKNLTQALKDYIANMDNNDIPDAVKLPGILSEFKNSPLTSNSFLLGLLERNPQKAVKYLDSFLISLEALKRSGDKSRDDMGITNLSDKDAFVTLLGMFASSEGEFTDREIESTYDKKVKLRKGVINFPTVSDSSQLPFLKTILIEMSNENVDLESSQLDESILSILREQLLIADLNRIADYIAKVGDSTSNLDGYDAGAIWITGLPSLNTVQVPYSYEAKGETVNTKRPLIYVFRDFIAHDIENNNPKAIQEFVDLYAKEINAEINSNVNHEADKLITSDLKSGDFVDFELMSRDELNLNDGREEGYFYKKPARLVAYDYVVNNLIQQKEIQTIFAGDIALYFKNKMETGLKHGLPIVEFKDVVNFHYNSPGQLSRIQDILKDRKPEDLTAQDKAQLISEFPELAYTDELITATINHEEAYNKLLPVASAKVMTMFKDVQNNLSKRLKGQISPGSQLTNSKNSPAYIQIMVSDVENSSETIEDMIQRNYPDKYESLLLKVREFKALDNLYNRTSDQNKRYKELKSELDEAIPKISAYLKTASTDAQEYTSWKENLNQLKDQGRITPAEYTLLESKLLAQTEDLKNGNFIREENKLTKDEMKLAIMQPSKPLYSGMVNQDVNNTGHNVQRYVYVKSSSFPLLPELTQMFPKLNNLRKTIDRLEKRELTTVRVSFQSANKVGAVKNAINISKFHKNSTTYKEILKSSVRLSRDNFYIQQDKPFKSDKNAAAGKPDRNTRATQFEKIILGDGINKLGYEFPSEMFDQDLLKELGIEKVDGKINGPALKKIYNNLYEKEQKILSDKLFNKLGIDKYSDIQEGKPEVMENLVKLLNRRLSNKQDKKALDLLYKVEVEKDGRKTIQTMTKSELAASGLTAQKAIFKMPLFMTPNSRKFESVLNSVINKNNINLEMPGFSFPVASQEGFDYKGYSEEMYSELKEKGLIVSPDFDPAVGLKSTRDALTGELKYAQVFLANKYKVYNPTTEEYDYIDLTKYVDENNTIDLTKLPKDLLSMFSFRIPTSSHQSGTVIEVAGFLPHNMGDLMIVPKDHTVQIGEDYDIDVRYAYQYNYIEDENGNIKKLEYSDIVRPDKSIRDLRNDYDIIRRQLWDDYYQNKSKVDTNAPLEGEYNTEVKNPYLEQNRNIIEEIVRLEDALDNYEIDKLVHAIFKDQYEVDKISKEFLRDKISELESQLIPRDIVASEKKKLQNEYKQMKFFLREAFYNEKSDLRRAWNTYRNAYNQKGNELRVIENNLVAMYKSVFSSPNPEVQNLITKVLSTDFSEQSASEIDSRLSQQESYFNIYAPSVQRKVMKLGADGKMGIGVHSNAVTMNSLLQQLDTPLQFIHYWDDKRNMNIPYNIILGNNVFDGVLGKITDGRRRLSEYLMESQNSATDNQKLEIMGRRNENAETISVFSLLQMSGLEDDGILVNGNELSYASLFISQPILLEYVDTVKKYKSSTNKSYGNPETLAEEDVRKKYIDLVPERYWQTDDKGKVLKGNWDTVLRDELARGLDSRFLFNQLRPLGQTEGLDMATQYYILDNFIRLKKPAKQLGELQQFVNIENGGLGISYFDVIGLKDKIKQINSLDITTVDRIMTDNFTNDKKSLFSEMFGDMVNVVDNDTEAIADLEKDGYIFINKYAGVVDGESYSTYVKPTNHYSHKIMNSISLGYNLWNSLFPYDHKYIEQQIDSIVYASGVNPDSRRALELKYDIISNMKDYSYTNSRVLFENNIEKHQKEIFFDDKANGQESLGSYLMRLKNNPDFAYLFTQPFFKDLQIDVNEKTYPTIIKYNTGDISPINNLKMYNRLSKLVDSDKKLPNKLNGKEMTESELMKELLMYSLLADQGNGAIGFRQLLPLSLFEKYKVDAMLRNRNEVDNQEMTNFVYNGPTKAAESFMRNTMDEEGVIRNYANIPVEQINTFLFKLNSFIKAETGETNAYTMNSNGDIKFNNYQGEIAVGSFVRQYFQHNPDKISTPIRYSEDSKSKLQDVLKENNISLGDFNEGKMTSFSLANYNKPFVVIEGKDGTRQLFERYDSVVTDTIDTTEVSYYRRIPTLGVFGFNEYQANKSVSTSKVENNNFDTSWKNTPINIKKTVNYLNDTSLDTIVDTMINDYSGPYSALLTTLREFIPDLSNVQVRTVSDLAGKASYENEGGQIYITVSEKFLNNENTDAKAVQDAIIEELLHHVTVSTINDYVSFTGVSDRGIQYTVKKDENGKDVVVPAPLQTLLSVYGKAVQHYIAKHGIDKLRNQIEEFKGKVQGSQNSSIFTEGGITEDAYRSMNIHEFIAGIFIRDTEFSNEMATTPYMQSGKSVLAKFSESLAKFFHRIIPGAKKTSISANVSTALFEFLQEHHNTPNNKLTNIKKQTLPSNKTVLSAKELIDEINQDTPGTTLEEDNNPVDLGDLFSPNNVSLSNPITNVKLNCK